MGGLTPQAAHFNQGTLVFKSVGGLLRTPLFYNLFISNLDLSHIIYPKYSEGVSVMKKNYGLDWLLFISGLICIVTGLMLDFHLISGGREARLFYRNIHIYSGYFMAVGLLLHLFWHKGWISMATKKILGHKNTPASNH